jgi:hypothetical protein
MNKFTVLVVVLFLVIMGFLFYESDLNSDLNNNSDEKLEVNLIEPLEIIEPNEDVSNLNSQTDLDFRQTSKSEKLFARTTKSKRKEKYEYPFTEEGQAFMTRGELLLKDHNHVDTTKYSVNLAKQIEQAKYNLKLAKEIASISKKLYIETDEGKKMDPEVYAKINELSKNLIATVKKQQNIK